MEFAQKSDKMRAFFGDILKFLLQKNSAPKRVGLTVFDFDNFGRLLFNRQICVESAEYGVLRFIQSIFL